MAVENWISGLNIPDDARAIFDAEPPLLRELHYAQCFMQEQEHAGSIVPSSLSKLYGRAARRIMELEAEINKMRSKDAAND